MSVFVFHFHFSQLFSVLFDYLLIDLFNILKLIDSALITVTIMLITVTIMLITVTIMLILINKVLLILLCTYSSHDRRLLCQVQNKKRDDRCYCCNPQKRQARNKRYLSNVQHKNVPNRQGLGTFIIFFNLQYCYLLRVNFIMNLREN